MGMPVPTKLLSCFAHRAQANQSTRLQSFTSKSFYFRWDSVSCRFHFGGFPVCLQYHTGYFLSSAIVTTRHICAQDCPLKWTRVRGKSGKFTTSLPRAPDAAERPL